MDLFNNNSNTNLLPHDGEVIYYGTVLQRQEADRYLEQLLATIQWKHDEAVIFGKHFITKRKVAWYGGGFSYSYSNTTKESLPWTAELLELKIIAERITSATYNSCLLNLYHNGTEGMAWHSDDEKALAAESSIASISLGAVRRFSLRHRQSKETLSVLLEHGSLLEMKGTTQTHWMHSLPKTTKVTTPRINLTFRTMQNS